MGFHLISAEGLLEKMIFVTGAAKGVRLVLSVHASTG